MGFCCLLTFHQIMFFSFESDGNDYYFFLPLVIHGLGVGLIMVPTILFVISSVPPHLGGAAAAVCLAIRYLGFTTSIGTQNFSSYLNRLDIKKHLENSCSAVTLFLKNTCSRAQLL